MMRLGVSVILSKKCGAFDKRWIRRDAVVVVVVVVVVVILVVGSGSSSSSNINNISSRNWTHLSQVSKIFPTPR